MKSLYVGLIHHPVLRAGSVITSSVTNLDLHDISRVCLTYGVGGYFLIHSDEGMRKIAEKLLSYWRGAEGKKYNPDRYEALKVLRVVPSLQDAIEAITQVEKRRPVLVGTTARKKENSITIKNLKKREENPILLLFGTADGMEDNFLNSLDYLLEPIDMNRGYNHLSVRSAVSIFIDRFFRPD